MSSDASPGSFKEQVDSSNGINSAATPWVQSCQSSMSSDISSGHAIEARRVNFKIPLAKNQVRRSHLRMSFDHSSDVMNDDVQSESAVASESASVDLRKADISQQALDTGADDSLVGGLPPDEGSQTSAENKQPKGRKKLVVLTTDTYSEEQRRDALAFMEERKKKRELDRERVSHSLYQDLVARRPNVIPQPVPMERGRMETKPKDPSIKYTKYRNPSPNKAALKVGNLNLVGDQFKARKGYEIRVRWDAGRYGQANICLSFKINKHNLNEVISDDDRQVYYFVLEFKFKVQVDHGGPELWSIQEYTHKYLDADEPGTDNQDAVSGCPDERKDSLTTIKFTPRYVTLKAGSLPESEDIRRLGDQDLYGTVIMLTSKLPQVIQVWFNWRTHAAAEALSLKHLRNFFEQSLPPHLRTGSTLPVAITEKKVEKQPQQPASNDKKNKPKAKKPQQPASKGKKKHKGTYRPPGGPHGGGSVSSGRVTKAR